MQQAFVSLPARQLPRSLIFSLAVLALAARAALFPYVSEDATDFLLPWMQEFRASGIRALGGEFSNYNFPYLFLMFAGSLLPIEPLFAIKILSVAGDCLLAISVGAMVAQLRPRGLLPATAALISLFLPTVLLNASMWGQCDSIYTAFLMLSLRSVLANDDRGSWLWWAVALSFKLQAVFFLPVLLLIALRNRLSLAPPAMATGIWMLLSIPPVLFGRSFDSTLRVYIDQTQDDRLVSGAANIYVWVPTASAADVRLSALLLCVLVLLITAFAYCRGQDSDERLVVLAVTVASVCPLLLPQMHDRYFYVAEVMSLLLLRHKQLFAVPWLFAATGLTVYALYFLGNQHAWPLMLASIVQCFAVGTLFRSLWKGDKNAHPTA